MTAFNASAAQEHKEYNIRLFKRYAPIYDFIDIIIGHLRERTVSLVDLQDGMRVLDIACGTGAQALAFAKRGCSVVGIDLSPAMLTKARRKLKGEDITFILGDACNISYEDSSFDVSVISFGLHDMPEEIGLAVLKEMQRTTKPGGSILIVDYDRPKNRLIAFLAHHIVQLWESRYYEHFTKVGLKHYLDQVGLLMEKRESYLFGKTQIVLCRNEK